MQLETIRSEIERMRAQVSRQRKEILQLQRAGIPTASADALLQRMLDRIDTLCVERDRLKKELAPVKVVDGNADPWRRATRVRR
jgi:gamma-glutamyl phosphate reductase